SRTALNFRLGKPFASIQDPTTTTRFFKTFIGRLKMATADEVPHFAATCRCPSNDRMTNRITTTIAFSMRKQTVPGHLLKESNGLGTPGVFANDSLLGFATL